jgi:hypothetical protein
MNAQETPVRRMCGAMEAYFRNLERVPGLRQRRVELERATAQLMEAREARPVGRIVIPTVVHVVYKDPSHNITIEQINEQIEVLNKDFKGINADIGKVPPVWQDIVGKMDMEYVLATRDPSGSSTSGVTRTSTTRESFDTNDHVKFASRGGVDAWPTDRYLNLWVCKLGGGLLGYAQFPEGGAPETDGVVIGNTCFGKDGITQAPFHLGRTATHEVGHWFNLRHIWGDDQFSPDPCSASDEMDDTPNQAFPNRDEPTFPHITCSNGPNGDMFMNYMDYVDDKAMFMFTEGQVMRMLACLDGPRRSLWAS